MTDTTHYNLDKDNGTLTLTTAGVNLINDRNIYATYSFTFPELTNTQLQDALDRAQDEIDYETNNHWAVGSSATPDFQQITDEKHTGKGSADRGYFLSRFPIPDVSSNVSAAGVVGATSLTVSDSDGFLDSGTLGVDNNKIVYTGKDRANNIFLGVSGIADAISVGATAVPYVVETSVTESGSRPSWDILKFNHDYDIDYKSGRVHLFRSDTVLDTSTFSSPPPGRPNRFRANYIYGEDTVPADIKRLTLMIATKDLMHSALRRSLLQGMTLERRENIDIDEEWIRSTLKKYSSLKVINT